MTIREQAHGWPAAAARTLSGAAAVRVTLAYAAALAAISVTLTALGPHARATAISELSTNLHNLAHGHIATLVGSAFVEGGDAFYAWLPGLMCLLALGELIWRGQGLVIVFMLGHVGATLLVAVWLVAAIKAGWLPMSIAHATDVGVSYGAVCVLGALTASMMPRWRPIWVGWWLGTAMTVALSMDFTAAGHVVAFLLGLAISSRLPSIAAWTPVHLALLAVGGVFGYCAIAGSPLSAAGGLAGVLVAALIGWVVSARRTSAASDPTDSAALSPASP
jgi:hypothetical protein